MTTRILRQLRTSLAALVVSLALIAMLSVPLAQAQVPPRIFAMQMTHYIRFVVDFNSCQIPAAGTTCSFKIPNANLPYNAFLVAISKQIITTFNPTTSATISLNVTGSGAGVMAAFNVFTGQATTAAFDTGFTGAGEAVTGNGAALTGTLGGFDLFALYTVGAAGSQGTQGRAVFILQYIAPNDGVCVSGNLTQSC